MFSRIGDAEADGCTVADDGTVSALTQPSALAVMLSGGSPRPPTDLLKFAPAELAVQCISALDALAASDNDTAQAIDTAFDLMIDPTTYRARSGGGTVRRHRRRLA